jgi:hypothetical protein
MRRQKTLLSFDVNVYTAQSTLTVRRSATKEAVVYCGALRSRRWQTSFSCNLRLSDYVLRNAATPKLEAAAPANNGVTEARTCERTIMETPAKQVPTSSTEIVMIIRKLRWAGLDEKAEQLETELERHAATAVVSTQNETD